MQAINDSSHLYDYVIIGGGIVGASTAWQLMAAERGKRILLLEKESSFARHQTSHNSGVIHAGVYYAPASLKSRFCREGVEATLEFCRQNDIHYEQCGKLIVATNHAEYQRMLKLYERGRENGLDLELLDADQLQVLEPNITGVGAIHVSTTGIVNYAAVCEKMIERFREQGGETMLDAEVVALDEGEGSVAIQLNNRRQVTTRFLVACTGLMADRTARLQGLPIDFRIVPYRGEYYLLPAEKNDIVRHLIYPVPNPELPFLGVHLTRMIDGSVTVGPSAVQGWKREGYGRWNVNLRDTWEMLSYAGFWKLSIANLGTGLRELRNSFWKRGYLKAVQKYCPSVEVSDLRPYPTGIRAMAVREDGSLIDDFLVIESPRSLHVCNAPSPAATSSIPVGRYIRDKVLCQQALLEQ